VLCSDDNMASFTPQYQGLMALAAIIICIYPVGVPLAYAVLLLNRRRRGLDQNLKFLTRNYTERCFYWELVETAKRLLLASFFALPWCQPGTSYQLLAAQVAQLVFLVAHVYQSPFKRRDDNAYTLLVNMAIALSLFCCMLLKQDTLVEAVSGRIPDNLRDKFYVSREGIANVYIFSIAVVSTGFVAALLWPIFKFQRKGTSLEEESTQPLAASINNHHNHHHNNNSNSYASINGSASCIDAAAPLLSASGATVPVVSATPSPRASGSAHVPEALVVSVSPRASSGNEPAPHTVRGSR